MSNFAGSVHGGALLKLLDQVAYACASRYAASYVVTLSVDRVLFHEPIRVGELVSFSASVNYTGRTSMEIGIRVDAQDIRTGTSRHANSCYFTMVAVDDSGRPRAIPPLVPVKRRRAQAVRSGQATAKRRSTIEPAYLVAAAELPAQEPCSPHINRYAGS